MTPDESLAELMSRLRAGDADAAFRVFHGYAQRLVALARSRLDRMLRRKVDPEDVLQSVFRSFFGRCAGGSVDIPTWDSLWALLVVITLRKCGRRVEHFHAARRDARREMALVAESDASDEGCQAVTREPTPDEAAMLAETVEQCLRPLDERGREILSLSLQGYTAPEISARVGRTERTVYRTLEQVRRQLERLHAAREG